jgi:hypothetical protein
MLYVQSFTLIKSTGARISLTRTGGIPSPTVQNSSFIMSMVYFRKLHSEVHDLHNSSFTQTTIMQVVHDTQRYDFWISPIAMNLR